MLICTDANVREAGGKIRRAITDSQSELPLTAASSSGLSRRDSGLGVFLQVLIGGTPHLQAPPPKSSKDHHIQRNNQLKVEQKVRPARTFLPADPRCPSNLC